VRRTAGKCPDRCEEVKEEPSFLLVTDDQKEFSQARAPNALQCTDPCADVAYSGISAPLTSRGKIMSNNGDQKKSDHARYEFRVWGDHPKACRKLAKLADEKSSEEFEDCYLLGNGPKWNAKVRDDTLKVKRLVDRERGFDRWDSNWHRRAESAPSPFDEVFDELSLDRPQRGKPYSLLRAVSTLDEDGATRAVFVTKVRTRYRIGSIRAEMTEIDVHDTSVKLRTLAIEGNNLDKLVALRRKLGLKGHTNVAMHVALDEFEFAS
jgi:propanediol dehydratase small subunit